MCYNIKVTIWYNFSLKMLYWGRIILAIIVFLIFLTFLIFRRKIKKVTFFIEFFKIFFIYNQNPLILRALPEEFSFGKSVKNHTNKIRSYSGAVLRYFCRQKYQTKIIQYSSFWVQAPLNYLANFFVK